MHDFAVFLSIIFLIQAIESQMFFFSLYIIAFIVNNLFVCCNSMSIGIVYRI